MSLLPLPMRMPFWLGLVIIFLLMQNSMAWSAGASSGENPGVFVGQGQAVYNPGNPSKSQHEAIQDLLGQAVIQAAAAILSPGQLGKQYQLFQEKVLKQPERYVQTYQVFSENPNQGGLYRVAGQVSVAMDLLKGDLAALGLAPSKAQASQSPAMPAPGASPSSGAAAESGTTLEKSDKASVPGLEVLWAVAENWDDQWHLPSDRKDPEGLFAAYVSQGCRDYGWSLRWLQTGTITAESNGEVSANQALAQARELGLQHVVIGTVALVQNADRDEHLQAALRLLRVSSGKVEGEIHRELATGDSSKEEAALELAEAIIPQLDRQLRQPSRSEPVSDAVKPSEAGELVLQIRSKDAYADWLGLEQVLREQFKTMQVKGFEIKPEQSIVRLDGVDEAGLRNLHGIRLQNGTQLQIVGIDGENHVFTVTFIRSGMSPAEPRP